MPDDLRAKVRAVLPNAVLRLMDEIEAFAGMFIRVEPNPYPPDPQAIAPLAPAAEVRADRAFIYLHDFERIDPQGVLHELLHVERYWVRGVPQVMPKPWDANRLKVTSSIENSLEHVVIVPREAEFGYERFAHWNKIEAEFWGRYPWPGYGDPFVRRKNSLLGWLASDLVNDERVLDLMRDCLRRERMTEEAERFKQRIQQLIASKPRAISATFRFLRIPRGEACLLYLDVKNRARVERPLPRD